MCRRSVVASILWNDVSRARVSSLYFTFLACLFLARSDLIIDPIVDWLIDRRLYYHHRRRRQKLREGGRRCLCLKFEPDWWVVVGEVRKKTRKQRKNEPRRFYFKILWLLRGRRNEDGLKSIHTSILIIIVVTRKREKKKRDWPNPLSSSFTMVLLIRQKQTSNRQKQTLV